MFEGEGEFLIAAMMRLGLPEFDAHAMIEQEYNCSPGNVPSGIVKLGLRVCRPCADQAGFKVGPFPHVPLFRQPDIDAHGRLVLHGNQPNGCIVCSARTDSAIGLLGDLDFHERILTGIGVTEAQAILRPRFSERESLRWSVVLLCRDCYEQEEIPIPLGLCSDEALNSFSQFPGPPVNRTISPTVLLGSMSSGPPSSEQGSAPEWTDFRDRAIRFPT